MKLTKNLKNGLLTNDNLTVLSYLQSNNYQHYCTYALAFTVSMVRYPFPITFT